MAPAFVYMISLSKPKKKIPKAGIVVYTEQASTRFADI